MFVCVANTNVDWQTFLAGARRALARNVTSSTDATHGGVTSSIAAYICAIAEVGRPGGNNLAQLRSDGLARRHASYTFLVELPRAEFITLAGLGLSVTPADEGNVAVVSGRLSEWVHAVVEGTQRVELRKFFCLLHAWFEREGLIEIWGGWEKEHHAEWYSLRRK